MFVVAQKCFGMTNMNHILLIWIFVRLFTRLWIVEMNEKIEIDPDIQSDWKHIPFADETFDLVVFDPPHLVRAGKTSWLAKKYGTIDLMGWPNEFHKAFQEIMRVMKPTGVMVFKWNEDQIPIKEVFKAFGKQPIVGDMRSKTKWSVFIKT